MIVAATQKAGKQTKEWLQPGKSLPNKLQKRIEVWVEVHKMDLLIQWNNAQSRIPVTIV